MQAIRYPLPRDIRVTDQATGCGCRWVGLALQYIWKPVKCAATSARRGDRGETAA